jgi:hypothetical protein
MLRAYLARRRARRLAKIAGDYGYLGDADRAAIHAGRDANNHMSTPVRPMDRMGPDRR